MCNFISRQNNLQNQKTQRFVLPDVKLCAACQAVISSNLVTEDLLQIPLTTLHLHNKVHILHGKKMLEVLFFYSVLYLHEETTIYLTRKIPYLIISFESIQQPNLYLVYYRLQNIKIQVQLKYIKIKPLSTKTGVTFFCLLVKNNFEKLYTYS